MTAIVILLIIIGLAFIFASYKLMDQIEEEKEEVAEIKIPSELTEENKKQIDEMIDDYMKDVIEDRLSGIEEGLSAIVNEKTLALGDYAVTVNEEIERNHNEVMFLYSMLSDKQKEIIETTTEVDSFKKDIDMYVASKKEVITKSEEEELSEAIREIDEEILENTEEEELVADSNTEVILEMYKSGLSILDIAKQLGLGVGEVKLVVDLYQGVNR